jgi:class 3 adenylate cyclase
MTSTSDVSVMREERKLVTVLFADLVGSTSIAERFDREDACLNALLAARTTHIEPPLS